MEQGDTGMLKKYIGTRTFYRRVLALMIPIMIQNGITNFVSMLDNVMVGQVGTLQMTGVAIANQLVFVFNLCIFGAISGAGIFGAQYYGKGDTDGVRYTFRFKVLFGLLLTAIAITVFVFYGEPLMKTYLTGEGTTDDIAASLSYGKQYLTVILIGLLPYTMAQVYSGTLRETGRAVLPMVAGVVSVLVNLLFNYFLIFGKAGFPCLGAVGAAIATVLSRFVELLIVAIATRVRHRQNPFIVGAFSGLYIPLDLVRRIMLKGLPLMINETLWAAGIAVVNQCYSTRGLDVVAANNINQTFFNVFSVAFIAAGNAIGILLGQILGAGKTTEAADSARKMIVFSCFVSTLLSAVYFVFTPYIPLIYNTDESVRNLATTLMRIAAVAMPIDALANAAYFTLRSGGKTIITFLFDSGFVWVVCVPFVLILSRFTALSVLGLFAVNQFLNLLKAVLGCIMVKKGVWIRNMVADSRQ